MMGEHKSAYELLIGKIDRFIRKYYVNLVLRGLLYWTGLVVTAFLLLTLTEFRAFFDPVMKVPLVSAFVLAALFTGWRWIARPLLALSRLGKRITHEQAASIIGAHFPVVKDKLLNILQLRSRNDAETSIDLVEASIDQKSSEIKLVPFSSAIDLGRNRKHLRYALPPLLLLAIILFGSPDIIRESTRRLSSPGVHFEKAAPFRLQVSHPDAVIQYQDVPVKVSVEGRALPSMLTLVREGKGFRMLPESRDAHAYTFSNISASFDFLIDADGFTYGPYTVMVDPLPALLDARVELQYPAYTLLPPKAVSNIGELSVPAGTKARWKFRTRHTTEVTLAGQPESISLERTSEVFEYAATLRESGRMNFLLSGEKLKQADSAEYHIEVVPDQYPSIGVREIIDSTEDTYLYFIGEYSDDYGISDLRFHYRIRFGDNSREDSTGDVRLDFEKHAMAGRFSHFTDAGLFELSAGDQLECYFEVRDNDAVRGAKSSRSRIFTFKEPSVEEYRKIEEGNNQAIRSEMEDAIRKVEAFNETIEQLKEESLEKKSVTWEERKKLEDLLRQHDDLSRSLEQMQQQFRENIDNQEEFKKVDEQILEKQERLEELMEELLTDEMREMMDQIRQMLEEMEMDMMFEELSEFEMSNEELEEQLDRMLELFKKLEFEQKMQDMINELEQLAEEQMELSRDSEDKNADSGEQLDKQERINERFDELGKELESLEELNKEQRRPADLDGLEELSEDISEQMQQGTEQLKMNAPQKASPSQQKAGEMMQQMAQQLASQMSSMEMMQATEDFENLRQLLENLVKLSFDQELLFQEAKSTETDQPRFRELVQQQHKLKDDASLIEDSLVELSKRVFQLQSFITEELHKMNREIGQSIEHLEARRKGPAISSQQYAMTSANNLALMLSETMEQMQQAMAQSMPGSQQCQKPGGKGGSLPSMKQLQQQLNQDMQQMMEGIQKGKQPGGSQMSKEFARMAAEQAALREALRKMKENMSQQQKEGGQVDELLQQMDETETELLNKRLTEEMLIRQEKIIQNLLDLETAEREQDKEEKRESETAGQMERKLPPEIEEYLQERRSSVEMYRSIPPSLTPFYKKLVEKYFNSVN